MSVVSLKYKTKAGTLAAPGEVDPGAFIPIATVTVGTAVANITFSNIPQNYDHLQIRGTARSSQATAGDIDILMQFNGDTGANYDVHYIYGAGGTSTVASPAINRTSVTAGEIVKDGVVANLYAPFITDILDYSNTNKNKVLKVLSGWTTNVDGYVYYNSGNWRSTAAITSMVLTPYQGNFMTYSTIALYGIKKAGA